MRNDRPTWPGRIERAKISRLYEDNARGIFDEDLIEEVGIGLLARIEGIFDARDANSGRAKCPICRQIVSHDGQKDTVLRCAPCDWALTWAEYHRTIRGKHLIAGGTGDFLREFATGYKRARTVREKMILIDTLIHRYHWELEGGLTRPGAIDLIGGKPDEIRKLLNELSYGADSTPEVLAVRDAWIEKVKRSRAQSSDKRAAARDTKAEREKRKRLKQEFRKQELSERSGEH